MWCFSFDLVLKLHRDRVISCSTDINTICNKTMKDFSGDNWPLKSCQLKSTSIVQWAFVASIHMIDHQQKCVKVSLLANKKVLLKTMKCSVVRGTSDHHFMRLLQFLFLITKREMGKLTRNHMMNIQRCFLQLTNRKLSYNQHPCRRQRLNSGVTTVIQRSLSDPLQRLLQAQRF